MERRVRRDSCVAFSSAPAESIAPLVQSNERAKGEETEEDEDFWGTVMTGLFACAILSLAMAFRKTSSKQETQVTLSWRGMSPGNGGGGWGFGPFLHSMMFAVAPLVDDEVEDYVPQPSNISVAQPLSGSEHGRPYDVSNSTVKLASQESWPTHLTNDLHSNYQISVRAVKGGRVTMEDEFYVAEGGRFAAVFDGHGGGGVSRLLKKRLYDLVGRHLKQWHWKLDEVSASKVGSIPTVAAHVAALRSAFEEVEEDVLKDDTLGYQGSTAVAVLVHESDEGHRTLLSANVGDSRAILSRQGRAVDLTRDHKPNHEREKARILSMGETIEWDNFSKVHRVRNLSLSRAIGDRYAKPTVSAEVEIKHYPVVDDGDEFFLLASDGLWDVMTSQDVVSFVHKKMEKELQREQVNKDDLEGYKLVLRRNMASFVAREALRRGTGDNVCVLMVWLG